MHLNFSISFSDIHSFIEHWSSKYSYPDEKYVDNIGKNLTKERLKALFEWKNGTRDEIAAPKLNSILNNYPPNFSGDEKLRYLSADEPGGPIWNIFFLHCCDHEKWPIFDQHTFRAMHYMETGEIKEIPNSNSRAAKRFVYASYQRYMRFVSTMRGHDTRKVDRALFAFGKFLKTAGKYAP